MACPDCLAVQGLSQPCHLTMAEFYKFWISHPQFYKLRRKQAMNFDINADLLAMIFLGIGIAIFAIGLLGDHNIRKTY